jgi:hypothetical protein
LRNLRRVFICGAFRGKAKGKGQKSKGKKERTGIFLFRLHDKRTNSVFRISSP